MMKLLSLSLLVSCSTLMFAAEKNSVKAKSAKTHLLQPGDWERLGTRTVDMRGDHDEILVTISDGLFTKLRLKIMKAPIHLININVVFGNGENQNFVFNKKFEPGSFTRVLDLPGNRRIIKKVKLNYKSVPVGNGRAVITLFGKH